MQMRSTLLCVHCEKNRCDTETQKNGQLSKVAPPESLGLASSPVADLFFAFFYGRPTFRAKLGSSSWSELPPFVANVEQLPRGAQKKKQKKNSRKKKIEGSFSHIPHLRLLFGVLPWPSRPIPGPAPRFDIVFFSFSLHFCLN